MQMLCLSCGRVPGQKGIDKTKGMKEVDDATLEYKTYTKGNRVTKMAIGVCPGCGNKIYKIVPKDK